MSDLHSNTVIEKPAETAFIEVSDPIYLTLLEAKKALGFDTLSDLIKDMLVSSKMSKWLEYPELLPVCEKQNMSYDSIMSHIINN
ncbi:MAG: hypothetical protein JKY01_04560 [Pseudomonadales bacterium]|nr:hypothetical protein [Pseudomonadales bacterium]